MKTHLAAAAAALVVCLCVSSLGFASVQTGDSVLLSRPSGYYGTLGGEFLAQVDDSDADAAFNNGDFRTFCVEIGEYVSLPGTYVVAGTGLVTVSTGSTLGSFAAWLYTKYLDGAITISDNGDANAVQAGIWLSMGYAIPGGFTYDGSLYSSLLSAYQADPWSTGPVSGVNEGTYTGQIQIMNLQTTSGGNAQDQLFRDPGIDNPPPPGAVPEPVSFLVWSMLAMCVGTLGLRRRDG